MASTDIVPVDQYAIAKFEADEFAEVIRDNLDGEAIGENDLPRVKIPGAAGLAWEFPTASGPEPRKALEGILLHKKKARVFFPTDYSGDGTTPSCASRDGVTGFGRPDATADDPFPGEPEQHDCMTCPLNQWGSALDGSRGKACGERQLLFLLPPDALLPVVVDLPPTSLKPCKDYFLSLSQAGQSYRRVVSRITLQKVTGGGVPDYSIPVFERAAVLGDEDLDRVRIVVDAMQSAFATVQ